MRILIACTQYPYHGGAATNSYALIKALRERKHTVCGLFFEDSSANCDPDRIGGILKSSSRIRSYNQLRKKIKNVLRGKPDIVLAKNYAAPIYCRSLFPNLKIIYLVSGAPIMIPLSNNSISAMKYLSINNSKVISQYGKKAFGVERGAIRACDAVIINSGMSRKVFLKTNAKSLPGRKVFAPLNTSIIINKKHRKKNKNFNEREIDIAFICSNFSRTVKNSKFAKKLFSHKKLAGKKKLIVGRNNKIFANIPNTIIKNKVDNKIISNYLNKTKLVICPSYFDASPNIINEALDSGCNILVSKNCGWHKKYGDESVCKDVYSISEWINKINLLCSKNIEYTKVETKMDVLIKLENMIKQLL